MRAFVNDEFEHVLPAAQNGRAQPVNSVRGEKQQRGRQHAEPPRLIPRRQRADIQPQDVTAPYAEPVRAAHFQRVVAGREVGVTCKPVLRVGADPVAIVSVEFISIAQRLRRRIIERGELDGDVARIRRQLDCATAPVDICGGDVVPPELER